ncbi:hypothetical protein DSM112329_00350 [Paraconexibacter sp. AEG42_29]|uniref:HTH tetR-type domain-containing protein n=1 Tax=Paraconexibacter sp. AEG42_29 TaxID=2997339 RepID=A0AAU7APG1_9ACTN
MPGASRPTRIGPTPRSAVRAEVLAATVRLLDAGERFTPLTVQRICDEARVARSAFYVNFGDKTELLAQLVAAVTDDVAQVADVWIATPETLTFDALVSALEQATGAFARHAAVLSAYDEVAAYDDRLAGLWNDRVRQIIDAFATRLEDARLTRGLRPDLDVPIAAEFIVLGAERMLRSHSATPGSGAELAGRLGALLWPMIAAD